MCVLAALPPVAKTVNVPALMGVQLAILLTTVGSAGMSSPAR
jgi:hypothetical protein